MPTLPIPAQTDSMLTWALWYGAQGYRIFPGHTPTPTGCSCRKSTCKDIGKHPRTKNGFHDATTDDTTLRRWWKMWPYANIGWVQDGTWTLDVDPKHGGDVTLEDLTAQHGSLPRTPLSHTGSGGRHYIFVPTPGCVIGNRQRFAPGLDTRADNKGYIIVPPSLHVSGQRYTWDMADDLETCAPVPAPDWLLALINTPVSGGSVGDGDPIPDGARNETLSRMAYTMRTAGMSIAEILAALEAINQRCVPPLFAAELDKIAQGKQGIGPNPVFVFHTNGTHAGTAAPPTWDDSTAWEEMVATHYPLRQWLIKGMIPHGLTILGGPPKSRKSTIAYDIALATVGEGLALGYWGCTPGGVLYCTCEDEKGDSKQLVRQLRPQMPDTPAHPLRFANRDEVPTLSGGLLDYVREQVTRHQLSLVVLDPLMYLLDTPIPRGEDPFLTMKKMLLPFHGLGSELGFACLFVDHTRKASALDMDSFTQLYGSQAKQAIAYTLMMVSREGDELTLDTKGRGAGEHTLLFTCAQDPTTATIQWTFGGADATLLSGTRQHLVLQAFANAREVGVFELSPRDVIDYAELQQTAKNYNNIRQALFKMRRKQVLGQTKNGLFLVKNPSILPDPTPADAGIVI